MTRPTDHTITVVIPTFNRRAQLQNAVESVLQERRVPIFLHIFDNASTDETESYARAVAAQDPRVSYTRRPENVGAVGNYSLALASISTEYFVPLADDDWLLPDFLHDAHQVLEKEVELGAAVFVTEARDPQGVVAATYPAALSEIRFGLLRPREHLEDWLRFGHYAWSSILWRTRTLECVGAPYMHVGLPSDVDFQVQIFCHYPAYLCNRPGAVYSLHNAQASGGYDVSHVRSWARLFQRLDREIEGQSIFSRGEYFPLREIMRQRYRPCWTAPARADMTARDRVAAACLAGFRLGDWETAFSLIQGVQDAANASQTVDRAVFRLPQIGSEAMASHPISSDGTTELVASVLGWIKQATEAIDRLEQDNVRLKSEMAVLKAELFAADEREERARILAGQNDRKRILAEAELEALRGHPLLRAMKRLRLLRPTKAA
ncbi:glycosyltransferase family 2 protein [Variovorax sp. J31P179]|uniref:glycosyltransferase family 2 protein n=1 Tax=Variovorax sp. J31P179 TaxID=3053508 RepID=UPI002574F2BC|nr:glycosyltransferase family 2 protein [Variovorax sp. J31P179]MDM0081983.1 glycosyltransferase family 2 protein [Variovorax sp. J31P179]